MKTTIKWVGDAQFLAETESGHTVLMDGPPDGGGRNLGPRPMEIVLAGTGGCSLYDVVSILRKMRIEPHSVEVVVTGEVQPDAPRAFTTFHLEYRFEGEGLPLPSLERAVVLSQEKYCSVSMTLIPNHVITWAISVNGQILKTSMEPRTEKV